jgi:hypothetical protein
VTAVIRRARATRTALATVTRGCSDRSESRCVGFWRKTSHENHVLAVTAVTCAVGVTVVTSRHGARAERSSILTTSHRDSARQDRALEAAGDPE